MKSVPAKTGTFFCGADSRRSFGLTITKQSRQLCRENDKGHCMRYNAISNTLTIFCAAVSVLVFMSTLSAEPQLSKGCITKKVFTVHPKDIKPIESRTLFLHIVPAKSKVLEGESIQITHWLENVGPSPEYYRTEDISRLTVIDSSLNRVTRCGLKITEMPVVVLNEDSSLSLTDWRILESRSRLMQRPLELLASDDWSVRYQCHELVPGRYVIFGDRINSDTITIEVLDPSGTSEQLASEAFLSAMALGESQNRLMRTGHLEKMELFLSDYPNSCYRSRALNELLRGTRDQAWKASLELIRDFPEHSFALTAINFFAPTAVSNADRVKYIASLEKFKEAFADMEGAVNKADSLIQELHQSR